MINRAKCKLCKSIIESLHPTDYMACKCGEIEVYGGLAMYVRANDLSNIIRVDDVGNEIVPKIIDLDMPPDTILAEEIPTKPTYKELVKMLEKMIEDMDRLPSGAMLSSVTQYDLYSLILLLTELFERLSGNVDDCNLSN